MKFDLREVGVTVNAGLAQQAFKAGFAIGADLSRTRRHRVASNGTHKYWMLGYEAGRDAARAAVEAFVADVPVVSP